MTIVETIEVLTLPTVNSHTAMQLTDTLNISEKINMLQFAKFTEKTHCVSRVYSLRLLYSLNLASQLGNQYVMECLIISN